jgi:WhiB family redox-sensing transcriptional regulator
MTRELVGDWREAARCRTVDADLFFHPDGERADARSNRLRRAKQVCRQCPVIGQCAAFALASREGFGIWGGMSEEERIRVYVAQGERPRGRAIHVARWNAVADTSPMIPPDLASSADCARGHTSGRASPRCSDLNR